jgi:hypothetical protein
MVLKTQDSCALVCSVMVSTGLEVNVCLCKMPCLVQCMAFGWWNFEMVGLERFSNAESVLCLVCLHKYS